MRKVTTTHVFLKDVKRSKKRGKCLKKLQTVIDELAQSHLLEKKFHPHRLTGSASDCFECHLENDWLLVYRINETMLELVRIGSHSDLFE
ncbi:MAG: type II toxin-antitoxin system YafQ family toxin [Pseudomonadota bacterium]|jgi:mRNA interferase YafQ|nr:type II toxin-antitoxin system YafQ family toxin [Alphaproteobacteria bacterium]